MTKGHFAGVSLKRLCFDETKAHEIICSSGEKWTETFTKVVLLLTHSKHKMRNYIRLTFKSAHVSNFLLDFVTMRGSRYRENTHQLIWLLIYAFVLSCFALFCFAFFF